MIMDGIDGCDGEIDENLFELAEQYHPKVFVNTEEPDAAKYVQMTIEDCFPGIIP